MELDKLNTAWIVLAIHALLAVVSAGHALLYKRDPRAARGWIAVSIAYPIAGPLLYYLFGINRLHTRAYYLKGGSKKRLRIRYDRPDNLLAVRDDKRNCHCNRSRTRRSGALIHISHSPAPGGA